MGEQQIWSLDEAVHSYAHWWREAGLHTATDAQPHGWRLPPAAPFWQRDGAAEAQAAVARPVVQRVAEAAAPRLAPVAMPDNLPAFMDWLASNEQQPEHEWGGALLLPPAQANARLLVLLDMPDMAATDAASLIGPAQRRFVMSMLASIGISSDEAAFASLAMRRAPGGMLDETTTDRLALRMRHYLGLARPQAAILLGDRTSRAMIGSQWRPVSEGLQNINHGSGTLSAVALASAEHLMSRPAAKARSWQALRLLPGVWN